MLNNKMMTGARFPEFKREGEVKMAERMVKAYEILDTKNKIADYVWKLDIMLTDDEVEGIISTLRNTGFNIFDILNAFEEYGDASFRTDDWDFEGDDEYKVCGSNRRAIARLNVNTKELYFTEHTKDILDGYVTNYTSDDIRDIALLLVFCKNEEVLIEDAKGTYEYDGDWYSSVI